MSLRKLRKEELDVIDSVESVSDLDSRMSRTVRVAAGTLAVFIIPKLKFFEKDNSSMVVGRHRLIYVKPDVGKFF